jgi:hypothetical protein
MLAAAQQRCCSGLSVFARDAARFDLQPLNINVSLQRKRNCALNRQVRRH